MALLGNCKGEDQERVAEVDAITKKMRRDPVTPTWLFGSNSMSGPRQHQRWAVQGARGHRGRAVRAGGATAALIGVLLVGLIAACGGSSEGAASGSADDEAQVLLADALAEYIEANEVDGDIEACLEARFGSRVDDTVMVGAAEVQIMFEQVHESCSGGSSTSSTTSGVGRYGEMIDFYIEGFGILPEDEDCVRDAIEDLAIVPLEDNPDWFDDALEACGLVRDESAEQPSPTWLAVSAEHTSRRDYRYRISLEMDQPEVTVTLGDPGSVNLTVEELTGTVHIENLLDDRAAPAPTKLGVLFYITDIPDGSDVCTRPTEGAIGAEPVCFLGTWLELFVQGTPAEIPAGGEISYNVQLQRSVGVDDLVPKRTVFTADEAVREQALDALTAVPPFVAFTGEFQDFESGQPYLCVGPLGVTHPRGDFFALVDTNTGGTVPAAEFVDETGRCRL